MNLNDSTEPALKAFDVESSYSSAPNVQNYSYGDRGQGFVKFLADNTGEDCKEDFEKHFRNYQKEKVTDLSKFCKETRFTFGKYKGETLAHALTTDIEYAKWFAFEVSGSKCAESRVLEMLFYHSGTVPKLTIKSTDDDDDDESDESDDDRGRRYRKKRGKKRKGNSSGYKRRRARY